MARRTEVVGLAKTAQASPRLTIIDKRFLPIGLLLVLLPLVGYVAEQVLRAFVWAALRLGGAL